MEELEQKLLKDKSFQHILKFAPESQRELMTFELAKYFQQEIAKASAQAKLDWSHAAYNKLVEEKVDVKNWVSGQIDCWSYELSLKEHKEDA